MARPRTNLLLITDFIESWVMACSVGMLLTAIAAAHSHVFSGENSRGDLDGPLAIRRKIESFGRGPLQSRAT